MALANYCSLIVKEQRDLTTSRLLERSSIIPTRVSRSFAASSTAVSIQLLEGESALAKDNHLLGQLQLDGLSSDGTVVEVVLDIDPNGTLHCSATAGNKSCEMVLGHDDRHRWSTAEVERMVETGELSF